MAVGRWYEKQVDGSLLELNLLGEHAGEGVVTALQVSRVGDPSPAQTPRAPVIDPELSSLTSRTSATLVWAAPDGTGLPPVTDYRIYRSDDGGTEVFIDNTGSASILTFTDTPLPTDTPEILFTYTVRAVNSDGVGEPSSALNLQWDEVVTSPPAAPTNFQRGTLTSSSVALTWDFVADSTVTHQGIFNNNNLLVNNIDKAVKSYVWNGLTPGATYSALNVRRYNGVAGNTPTGWSARSNQLSFTVPQPQGEGQFLAHQPGLTYIGQSTEINYQQTINEIGAEVNVYRIFNPSNVSKIEDCFGGRPRKMIPWLSIKPNHLGAPGGDDNAVSSWASIASGNYDSQIRNVMDNLLEWVQDPDGQPMVVTFHHEPIGPTNRNSDGTTYTNAFHRIIDVAESRPDWIDGKILWCPNYEEFTLRQGQTPNWNTWCNSAFMNRMHFMSWDMYQFAGTNAQNNATTRIPRIYSMMEQRGFGDMPLGIGEWGARQQDFGYDQNTSRYTSAQYARQFVDYMMLPEQQERWWITSVYNASDVGDSRLTTETRPPDTESYMECYREYLATSARLSTIGIT